MEVPVVSADDRKPISAPSWYDDPAWSDALTWSDRLLGLISRPGRMAR